MPIPAAYQVQMNPQMYQGPNQRGLGNYAPQTPSGAYQASPAPHPYSAAQPSPYGGYPANRLQSGASVYNPNAPRPIEVFHLSDAANLAIPADIREQFHCDDKGHVLFFSAPPLDVIPPTEPRLGHSLKYLAAKEDYQKKVAERKRKKADDQAQRDQDAKRRRADEETALASRIQTLAPKAIDRMSHQIIAGTDQLYKAIYHEDADKARAADTRAREHRVLADRLARQQTEQIQAQSANEGPVSLNASVLYPSDS